MLKSAGFASPGAESTDRMDEASAGLSASVSPMKRERRRPARNWSARFYEAVIVSNKIARGGGLYSTRGYAMQCGAAGRARPSSLHPIVFVSSFGGLGYGQ